MAHEFERPGGPPPHTERTKFRPGPHSPAACTIETRRTTLRIPQQNQPFTRSVLNPAVISFGENGPERERFDSFGARAGQQLLREKPAVIGLFMAVAWTERRSALGSLAEGKNLVSNVLHPRPNWCNSPAAKGIVTFPSRDDSLRTTPKAGEHIAAVRREEIAIAGPCDPRASRPATTTQDLARSEPRL